MSSAPETPASQEAPAPLGLPLDRTAVLTGLTRALWARALPGAALGLLAVGALLALSAGLGLGAEAEGGAPAPSLVPPALPGLALGAVYLARLVLALLVRRRGAALGARARWRLTFAATALLAGLALAGAAVFTFPALPPADGLALVLFVAGVLALETAVCAASFASAVVLVVPAVGALAAAVDRAGLGAAPATAIALLLFGAALLAAAWLGERGLERSVRLELERQALAEALAAEQVRVARALEAARAASRAKAELVLEMSRGVRTPLTGVLGMTELLLAGTLRTEERFFADAAHQSGRALLGVVDTLLDFVRLESGKVSVERAPFAVEEIVEVVLVRHGAVAAKKGLVLAHRVDRQVPARLVGDALRVKQALDHLVAYALRTTEKGEIEVTVAPGPNPGSQRFAVRDTGPGLEPFARARLFQRSEPLDPSAPARAGGSGPGLAAGFGLAIVRELVELMGGAVAVESQLGEGTEISFTLNLEADGAMLGGAAMSLVGRPVIVWTRHALHAAQLEAWLGELGGKVHHVRTTDELARQVSAGARLAVLDGTVAPDLAGLAARHPSLRLAVFDAPGHFGSHVASPVRRMSTPLTRTQLVRAFADLDERGSMDLDLRAAPRGGFEGARVLVADADPTSRTVLRGMFGRLGVAPTLVEDGGSALAAMIEERFDLALLDAELPDLDAVAVTKQLRIAERMKDAAPQVIVALTTQALETERARALEAGVADVLLEPISLATLEACLARFARRSGAREAARSSAALLR